MFAASCHCFSQCNTEYLHAVHSLFCRVQKSSYPKMSKVMQRYAHQAAIWYFFLSHARLCHAQTEGRRRRFVGIIILERSCSSVELVTGIDRLMKVDAQFNEITYWWETQAILASIILSPYILILFCCVNRNHDKIASNVDFVPQCLDWMSLAQEVLSNQLNVRDMMNDSSLFAFGSDTCPNSNGMIRQ